MNPHTQRGLLLYQQSRFPQAEAELRQSVLAEPQDPYGRALLSLALCHQERYNEAQGEALEALRLDPGFPLVHYTLAFILQERGHYPEALQAVSEAVQLDPEDPDYRALQAQIFMNQRQWAKALEAANFGLQLDPSHVTCTNLRAMALVKLGQNQQAGQTISAALAKDPENSVTHANQGWTLLHQGDHAKALEHFRESLRLNPENEWARQGTIEALKARHLTYSLMLKYFLWMSRLSSQMQWGIVLAGYFGSKLLRGIAAQYPATAIFIYPIIILYVCFVFLTWTADPLFNLLLRLNKFGRMVLNREEIVASNWVGAFVGAALLCLALGLTLSSVFLVGAFVFGFSVLPLSAVFKCQKGWPRKAMLAYASIVIGAGVGAFALFLGADRAAKETISTLLSVFGIGIILAGWVANYLMSQRVRK
jgi:tetratricopeptide (TPR) repeat protein